MDQEFLNWTTSTILILGALGASWKWIFEEMLRRRTDYPSLEGTISSLCYESDGETATVLIKAVWTNPTNRKVYLDTQESKIYLYDIKGQNFEGPIDLGHKDTKYLFSYAPYRHSDFVFYEPGTKSEFSATFVVPKGRAYAARAFIVMDETKMKKKNVWFRDTIVATSSANCLSKSD